MSPVPLIPGDTVAKLLKGIGCRFVAPIDDTKELWATDFGFHFIVPARGDDKMCPSPDLNEIVAEIERRRP